MRSSCSSTITRHIQDQPGVSEVNVNLVLNSAVVTHLPDSTSQETLVKEIEDIGYGATVVSSEKMGGGTGLKKTTFGLEGMTCR